MTANTCAKYFAIKRHHHEGIHVKRRMRQVLPAGQVACTLNFHHDNALHAMARISPKRIVMRRKSGHPLCI